MNSLLKNPSHSSFSIAFKVILVILGGEFLIMAAIEGVFIPMFGKSVSPLFWELLDPALLSIIVAPALHLMIFRPIKMQQLLLEAQKDILEKQADDLKIAAVTFNTQYGILITDANHIIIKINQAFTDITGFTHADVVGKTPAVLQSGRQDKEFYAQMWASLERDSFWQGEIWNRRKNGEIYPEFLTITVLKDSNAKITHYVGTFHDITLSKKAADEIKYLAFYDPLTGLANRRLMTDRMEQILSLSRRTGELVAICMIDLDGFKQVNDRMGHKAGDQLLVEVGRRLQDCIRHSDTASRFGGDEFALILGGFNEISECTQSISRIISLLAAPYHVVNEIAHVTASIGVTIFPSDGSSPDQLLRHADESMYEAKHAGKNCYRLFNPSLQNQQAANDATFRKIEKALADGQLTIYYQPQVDCRLGKVIGLEALLRWKHPILGLLSPADFIPLIEHDDLIITIGEWVLKTALKQLQEWRAAGIDLTVAVNISARQLHQTDFVDRLNILLADYDSDVISRMEIEVIETSVLEDLNIIAEAIQKCRALGLSIAIDDFGTGFSSLAHLRKIPFDVIKIDKSFVLGMLHNPEDLVLVDSVIGLATSFKRKVIAEGVESIDYVLMLLELGCNLMQGYEIARPMPSDQIPGWIEQFKPDPLWQLGNAQNPSRDYFEMLLAEVNHRDWIERIVDGYSDPRETFNPELLNDHRQCRFGHWYYGSGHLHFGTETWFVSMGKVHQRIHQTAALLCEHRRAGNINEIAATQETLLVQSEELILLLRNLRALLTERHKKGEPI